MGNCDECSNFRRAQPPSQLLSRAFPGSRSEVTEALSKVQEDEKKVHELELELKGSQLSAQQKAWPSRPTMSAFCGLRESDGAYLLVEAQNPGGTCDAQPEVVPPEHSCVSCVHRVSPDGAENDAARERVFNGMTTRAISSNSQDNSGSELLSQHRKGVSTRKAFEITGAYYSAGRMMTEPTYLAHCKALSTDTTFVVCALQNPWNVCTSWQGQTAPT